MAEIDIDTGDGAISPPDRPSKAISLGDVFRAIFFPPQARVNSPVSSERPNLQALAKPLQAIPDDYHDLPDMSVETRIVYESQTFPTAQQTTLWHIALLVGAQFATLIVAYFAQTALAGHPQNSVALTLYATAGAMWLLFVALIVAPPDGSVVKRGPTITGAGALRALAGDEARFTVLERILVGAASLALAVATYLESGNNTFTPIGLVCWLLNIVGWLITLAEREPVQFLRDVASQVTHFRLPASRPTAKQIGLIIIASGIVVVAAYFRFYRIGEIPAEMTSDHVEKLLDAYDVSQGIFHVFFPRNGGREAIQMYLVAGASTLFGTGMSFLTLKLVTAIEAVLLVPIMMWLGREFVDRDTGLFAGALLAISWWHSSLGRLGLRIVLTPLIFCLLLIVLARGIRTGSRSAWLWAGIWMGIGTYAYQALRITPLVAIAAFLVAIAGPSWRAIRAEWQHKRYAAELRIQASNAISRQAVNLAAAGVVAFAVFVPLLRFWHENPDAMWNRVVNRTTSTEVAIQGDTGKIFLDNYANALGMFNVRGDVAWISSLPSAPALDHITGILLVFGAIAWAIRIRVRRDPVDVLLILAGLIMLLPSALAIAFPIENPSLTRASGVMPTVFMLAAWPLALVMQNWQKTAGKKWGTALAAIVVVPTLTISAALNYQTYFLKFSESYNLSALNPGQVAKTIIAETGSKDILRGVWLIGWPYWHDYRAIGIEVGNINFHNALVDLNALKESVDHFPEQYQVRPLVFIVHEQDTATLDYLAHQFPDGEAKHYLGLSVKHNFYLYIIDGH